MMARGQPYKYLSARLGVWAKAERERERVSFAEISDAQGRHKPFSPLLPTLDLSYQALLFSAFTLATPAGSISHLWDRAEAEGRKKAARKRPIFGTKRVGENSLKMNGGVAPARLTQRKRKRRRRLSSFCSSSK